MYTRWNGSRSHRMQTFTTFISRSDLDISTNISARKCTGISDQLSWLVHKEDLLVVITQPSHPNRMTRIKFFHREFFHRDVQVENYKYPMLIRLNYVMIASMMEIVGQSYWVFCWVLINTFSFFNRPCTPPLNGAGTIDWLSMVFQFVFLTHGYQWLLHLIPFWQCKKVKGIYLGSWRNCAKRVSIAIFLTSGTVLGQ